MNKTEAVPEYIEKEETEHTIKRKEKSVIASPS